MGPFVSSLTFVVIGFSILYLITICGVFDNVELEIGLEHYAEAAWIPNVDCMPFNTLVNIGYTGLGLYKCLYIKTANAHGLVKDYDAWLFFVFNLMASVYGCVQLARIVTQKVVWAVLDQWCTLPFFIMLPIWGLYIQYGWSRKRGLVLISLSISSYVLTLLSVIGFEISLACHIVGAIYGGMLAYSKHPSRACLFSFCWALVSCSGFVFLKLLDFKLPSMCFIFRYVSGHFLSKICDIGQIFFVNEFFFDLTLQKDVDTSVKDKDVWITKDERVKRMNGHDIPYENPLNAKKL